MLPEKGLKRILLIEAIVFAAIVVLSIAFFGLLNTVLLSDFFFLALILSVPVAILFILFVWLLRLEEKTVC